jgi:hypothetical protein
MAEPAKRIPQWLTIDVLVIVVSLVIIGVGSGSPPRNAICWACDSSGSGGRPYPFSGEQVRVREADREITRLCAWGDKVHRKDRPEREEARDLERTKIPIPACRTVSSRS